MNHRERVLTALNHREPDRVPIDFGSSFVTGILAIPYRKLNRHLGIKGGRIRVFDMAQQLAEPEMKVLEKIGLMFYLS